HAGSIRGVTGIRRRCTRVSYRYLDWQFMTRTPGDHRACRLRLRLVIARADRSGVKRFYFADRSARTSHQGTHRIPRSPHAHTGAASLSIKRVQFVFKPLVKPARAIRIGVIDRFSMRLEALMPRCRAHFDDKNRQSRLRRPDADIVRTEPSP